MMTVPNALTFVRLLSLPVAAVLFRNGLCLAAALVFVAGMLTDAFDGWLARKLNQTSKLGLYLDPVTDKIVILGLLYELAYGGVLSMAVPHLLLVRELLQNAVRAVAAAQGDVVGANWMGKTKAFLQTVVVAWGLLMPVVTAGLSGPAWRGMQTAFAAAAAGVVLLAWVFFGIFLWRNRRLVRG